MYLPSTWTFGIVYSAHSVYIWASCTSRNQWYYYPNGPCLCVTVSASSHSLWLWNWRGLMSSGVCRTAIGTTRNILLCAIRDFSYNKPRSLPQQLQATQSFCFILIWIMLVCLSRLAIRLLYSIPTFFRKTKTRFNLIVGRNNNVGLIFSMWWYSRYWWYVAHTSVLIYLYCVSLFFEFETSTKSVCHKVFILCLII